MLAGIIKNSAVNSKILAMKRGDLKATDYIRLSNLSSVTDAAEYLKTSSNYSRLLKNTDISSIHRAELEALLQNQLSENIKSLITFSGSDAKFFLNIFSVKEDIENIKLFIRHFFTKNNNTLQYNNYFTSKTFERLNYVTDFNGFFDVLKNTTYEKIFKSFLEYPEKQNLFDIETALDMFYKRLCLKSIKKYLSKSNAKIAMTAYGTVYDIETLLFILRFKKYYSAMPEKIYPYISTFYLKLSTPEIRAIIESATFEKAIEEIRKTAYGTIFSQNIRFFEKPALEYILRIHWSLYRKNQYSIAAILYYIKFKETEIKNIITIIEGLRYGLEPSKIQNHITELSTKAQEEITK